MNFTYLIGVPGVGKTTAIAHLTANAHAYAENARVPHVLYLDEDYTPYACQVGVARRWFGGTDGLSMSIQPKVIEWLDRQPFDAMFAEGDRLANDKMFEGARAAGYDVHIVCLTAPAGIAWERRDERASKQNAAWLKGRSTKVYGLAHRWGATYIDAERPVAEVVDDLRKVPVFDRF